ncbi:ATP-NAD kinase-like domain-containing protein [Lipomyces starkeyi]
MSTAEVGPHEMPYPSAAIAPAECDALEEDNKSTSSDGDPHGFEVIVDPRHRIARRRRASMVNKNASTLLSGMKSQGGCLLHTLLDSQRTRRKSQDLYGSTVGIGDEDDGGYASAVDDLDHRQESVPQRRLTRSMSPPPEMFAKMNNNKTTSNRVSIKELPPSTGYSRLLTKKQLAEMAFSVRDLSKYLGTLKIKMRVRKILVITKIWDKATIVHTNKLVDWLLSNYTVYVQDVLKEDELFDEKQLLSRHESRHDRLKYWNFDLCEEHPQMFDLVITLGGDGTVLYTSRLFQRIVPPVLSFNLGSLGFLTKFDFMNHEKIVRNLIDEGVIVSLRMRFECTVMKSTDGTDDKTKTLPRNLGDEILDTVESDVTHEPGKTYSILNEVVVDRGPKGTMCTAELYVDDEHLTTVEADGVVIATPTGSTAYSLSAGGSLVHPDIQGMLVSPICAHSLSFRPLVVPDNAVLRVGVPYGARSTVWCSFDGKDRIELSQGDYVTISASRFPFPMIQSKRLGSDWFDSLRSTLNWNQRQQQKTYTNS